MMGSFYDGLALTKKENCYNFINTTGQTVVSLKDEYDVISHFDGKYAKVKKDGRWGIVAFEN